MRDIQLENNYTDPQIEAFDLKLDDDIVQRVTVHLRFFLGEWFLDTRRGLDWYGRVYGKGKSLRAMQTAVARYIRGIEGVNRLDRLEFDGEGRELTIRFTVNGDQTGEVSP